MIESASLDVWQMWAILGGLVVAIVFFVWDRFPIEIVSASIVAALMLFFHFSPRLLGGTLTTMSLSRSRHNWVRGATPLNHLV